MKSMQKSGTNFSNCRNTILNFIIEYNNDFFRDDKTPINSKIDIDNTVTQEDVLSQFPGLDMYLVDLLDKLLQIDSTARYQTMDQVLAHPWFASARYQTMDQVLAHTWLNSESSLRD